MAILDWIKEKVVVSVLKPWYDKLEGKKTYIILGVSLALGLLETWNALCGETIQAKWCVDLIVPPWIYAALAALGIYTRKVAKLK
jgi:hypothetical protein